MTNTTPPALSEEQVREAVNRWSTGYFRIRYLGDKIFLEEVASRPAYVFRMKTQYEDRAVKKESEPYAGGPVDNRGTPPDPWDMPARRPTDFEERTETARVPHTEHVSRCRDCAGDGRVGCKPCVGTGKTVCSACQGKGYREETEFEKTTDAAGNPTTRPVTVKKHCPQCQYGKVTCNTCHGNGRVTCSGCDGSGEVRTFDRLTVHFRCPAQIEVLDVTETPHDLLTRLSGDVLFDERKPRIEECSGVSAQVAEHARGMLKKSHGINAHESRLLFQSLQVEQVPVHEVKYKYAGKAYTLWICGSEREVHAPDAPWLTGRLWGLLGGIFLGILVVVLLIILLMAFLH